MTPPQLTGGVSWADDPRLRPWNLAPVPNPDQARATPATVTTTPAQGETQRLDQPSDEAGRPDRHAPAPPTASPAAGTTGPEPSAPAPSPARTPDPRTRPTPDPAVADTAPSAWPPAPPWSQPASPAPDAASADPFAAQLVAAASVPRPREGVRGLIFTATRGRVNPGPSPSELDRLARLARVRRMLSGWHTITVASMKGGVGKTSVAALLGLTLAEYRGDRVVALDANPDAGTLADRLLGRPVTATVRDLVGRDDLDRFVSLNELGGYLHTAGRLQVLASEQDPAMSEAFNRDEYRRVLQVLTRFFNTVITDSGTGLMHSALAGALEATRSLVIVGAPTIDGGSRAAKTLDWLAAHGFDELVADAVVVLSCDRVSRRIDRAQFVEHFAARCRAVVEIPADPHLAEGGLIELEALRPRTRDAALTLAAHVADAFAWSFPTPPGFTDLQPTPGRVR